MLAIWSIVGISYAAGSSIGRLLIGIEIVGLAEEEQICVDSRVLIAKALRLWTDDEISVIGWREYRLGYISLGT